jgi:AraC-like DNA-binding protein
VRDEHQRWLDKVNKTEDCWLWTGTTYRGGYGHFRRKMRDIGLKMKDISDIVGVSVPQVSRIVNHKTHSSVSAAGG